MSDATYAPETLELPPMGELISGDVNAGSETVYVGWATDSIHPPDGDLHAFVTTDERAACVCRECGAVCRTPPEVRSNGELRPGHFTPTADPGGTHVARPPGELYCVTCGEQADDVEGWRVWPQREHTPHDWYDRLGRVQRAVVDILCRENGYTPPCQTSLRTPWAGRTDLTRQVAAEYYDDATANTITSSVSRAVQTLIDDPPVLVGAYREWTEYWGDKTPGALHSRNDPLFCQGETPNRGDGYPNTADEKTPTLEKVRLRWNRDLAAAGVYFAWRERGCTLQVEPGGETDE